MTLTDLLASIQVACEDERTILGISDDSRNIKKDWLFLCRHGSKENGEVYVQDVLNVGGVVLWEKAPQKDCYHIDQLEKWMGQLLNTYYHYPCRNLCVIGVTGTNGKTSVTMILQQLFQYLGKETMVIGTNHIRYRDVDDPIQNTTPSACMLAYYFAKAVEYHIPYVLMEVSSHAIDQQRIGAIRFDYILYTNIEKDHLDYHITRTHYMYTKFKLRNYLKRQGVMIINHDLRELHPLYHLGDHKIITFGSHQAHLQIQDIECHYHGTNFKLEGIPYAMRLMGKMNVYNTAEALTILHRLAIPVKKRQAAVANLQSVAGRMEVIEDQDRSIWLDYAHTQSALEQILVLAQAVKQAKVICVIGCGGNRDKEKRPQMAQTAIQLSDVAIFTADNPRDEEVHVILQDMIAGIKGSYEIRENRESAIKYAMKIAGSHDIIVIAGKGDETTQTVNGKTYPLQDRELVRAYRKMEE